MAANLKITITNNAVWQREIQYVDRLGVPSDLTGVAMRADFKLPPGTGTAALTISTVNGRIVLVDAANGWIQLIIPGTEIDVGEYVFDLLMTKSAVDYLMAVGTLSVLQGVTS